MTDNADMPDKWRQLRKTDDQYALIKQALDEARQAIEQSLHYSDQLNPEQEAELIALRQSILGIDHALLDIAAEARDLTRTVSDQQGVIDRLNDQRDEAYLQRDHILRLFGWDDRDD